MATAAQAQQTSVRANVPFDFVVGNNAYPAGEYALKSLVGNGVPIRVENLQEETTRSFFPNLAPATKRQLRLDWFSIASETATSCTRYGGREIRGAVNSR